jgi:hypothetical protein
MVWQRCRLQVLQIPVRAIHMIRFPPLSPPCSQTAYGDIHFAFLPGVAPITAQHIFKLLVLGAYTGNHFFRVDKGFVAQVGQRRRRSKLGTTATQVPQLVRACDTAQLAQSVRGGCHHECVAGRPAGTVPGQDVEGSSVMPRCACRWPR